MDQHGRARRLAGAARARRRRHPSSLAATSRAPARSLGARLHPSSLRADPSVPVRGADQHVSNCRATVSSPFARDRLAALAQCSYAHSTADQLDTSHQGAWTCGCDPECRSGRLTGRRVLPAIGSRAQGGRRPLTVLESRSTPGEIGLPDRRMRMTTADFRRARPPDRPQRHRSRLRRLASDPRRRRRRH